MNSFRRTPLAANFTERGAMLTMRMPVTAELVASRKGRERGNIPPLPEADPTVVRQHACSDRGRWFKAACWNELLLEF
jgi:hypothetical protein